MVFAIVGCASCSGWDWGLATGIAAARKLVFGEQPGGGDDLIAVRVLIMIRDLSQALFIVVYGVVAVHLFRMGRLGVGVASCDDFVMPL